MRIKAAILEGLGKSEPVTVGDIEMPEKLGIGQVLVEIHYSGICGAQLGEVSGAKGEDRFVPHLLGHEGSGVVVDKGICFNDIKEGDKVVAHWRRGRGCDADFPTYKWGNRTVGGGKVTTFSQYSVISENRLTVVDKNTDLLKAAAMGCSLTTGLGLINNEAKLKMGQSIMVLGCGGVGLSIIQGAKMVSANPIIAVDTTHAKVSQAHRIGADMSVYNSSDLVDSVKNLVNEVDVVVDTTGNPSVIDAGWKLAKEKMILVGQPHWQKPFIFTNARDSFYAGKVMMDSQGGLTDPNVDIPRYLELEKKGKLDIPQPIVYPLRLVNDAMKSMRQGAVGKVMLEMHR